MTAGELSKKLGVSRATMFRLRSLDRDNAPKSFDDVDGWREFIATEKPDAHQEAPTNGQRHALASAANFSNVSYVEARARKTAIQAEMAQIQLEATRRSMIKREEVKALFARLASRARGKVLRVMHELPCALVGLDPAEIDKIVREKLTDAMSELEIPAEFFEPESAVK